MHERVCLMRLSGFVEEGTFRVASIFRGPSVPYCPRHNTKIILRIFLGRTMQLTMQTIVEILNRRSGVMISFVKKNH